MPRARDLNFELGPKLRRALDTRPHQPGRDHLGNPEPQHRPLRVFARDPSTSRLDGAIVTLKVPYEPLAPGPVGKLLRVVDRTADGLVYDPVNLDEQFTLLRHGVDPTTGDPRFGQQMVYAVCSTIYDRFRRALGRDPSWGFERTEDPGRLILRPHADSDQNAWYDPQAGELAFGFYVARAGASGRNQERSHVFTCLSHDIVVHEMSHALLDGMRELFTQDTNPDVGAFHEGFSDLVAIFQHFSYRDHVEMAIERAGGRLDDRLLVDVATQFGHTRSHGDDRPLRTAIPEGEDVDTPEERLDRYDTVGTRPHALGSVLVAAVFEAYRVVYRRKTRDLLRVAGIAGDDRDPPRGPLPEALVRRLAREAGALAEQFLNIVIRAVDYCPPVDLTLGEYLRAMVTADHDLVPDDPWGYREALVDAFRRRRVRVPDVSDLSEENLLWQPPDRSLGAVDRLAFGNRGFDDSPGRVARGAEMDQQARALGRFVCQHDHLWYFGLIQPGESVLRGDPVDRPVVQSLRSVQRVGPDGQLAFDLVAEVIQRRVHRATGAAFYGGATVILGPDGSVRFTIRKNTGSTTRIGDFTAYRASAPPAEPGSFFRRLCERQ